MRKDIRKLLLGMAVVLAVFMGKGGEAKAYDIVDGKAYISWDEYENWSDAEVAQLEPWIMSDNYVIVNLWRDEMGMPIVTRSLLDVMDKYVPSNCFDYDWYLQEHPELIEICGTDKNAIYAFYAATGQAAGWHGRIAPDKLISAWNFDYERYAAENPDVAAMVGQDEAALYAHYVNSGMLEGRKGYATDDMSNAYLKIYEVSSRIIRADMDDYEKVKAVHDWMVLNIAYDEENYDKGYDMIPDESFSVVGAMNKGIAVCNGYAETFKAFMNIQGIECSLIAGDGLGGYHGWNKVKLDGEYYYIDVTWDDPDDFYDDCYGPGYVEYDYYLTKDPTFGGTHTGYENIEDLWNYLAEEGIG